jgi:hypothetical protein
MTERIFNALHTPTYDPSFPLEVDLASELSIEKKIKYSRQAANSQSMGFAINISHAQ